MTCILLLYSIHTTSKHLRFIYESIFITTSPKPFKDELQQGLCLVEPKVGLIFIHIHLVSETLLFVQIEYWPSRIVVVFDGVKMVVLVF
jgi:hypothetical protein